MKDIENSPNIQMCCIYFHFVLVFTCIKIGYLVIFSQIIDV